MRIVKKLLQNALLGFIAIFCYNLVGQSFGMSVGLNLVNTAIIGVLGVPGFAAVLILNVLSK